jgi:hypothetical protein
MTFSNFINDLMEKNYFNEFADFDKKIERRERFIQVMFIILGLLVSYNANSLFQRQLFQLFLIFSVLALLYYVALPVSIDKTAHELASLRKEIDDDTSSCHQTNEMINSIKSDITTNEALLKEYTNLSQSEANKPDNKILIQKTKIVLDEQKKRANEFELTISSLLITQEDHSTRVDRLKFNLNFKRLFIFILGACTACAFSFFLFFCYIGFSNGYVHSFSPLTFLGYIYVTILVSIALYV